MPTKTKTIAMISAGFIAGCALTASLFLTVPAQAESDDCRQADMTFNSTSSALGATEMAIKYELPRCLMIRGYKIVNATVIPDNWVEINYRKGNF